MRRSRRGAIAAMAALALAAATAAVLRSHALESFLARRAARRAELAPAGPHGRPLRPAPLVSRGRKVVASGQGAEALVDGRLRSQESWAGGLPTPERPAWAAIRIGSGPSRLLVSFTSSHNHDWFEQFYGAPVDYRIEVSGDSTDGRDGAWRTAVAVTGNPVRSRAHAIDFAGASWVRLVVTRLPDRVNPWGLFLDEIEVHDLSLGGDDVWLFLGDSITAAVFDRAEPRRPSFPDAVARLHPGYRPAMIDAGLVRVRSGDLLARIDELLALAPDARVIAIGVGSNDGDLEAFRRGLAGLVARIEAAGRIPVVARIPFRTGDATGWTRQKNEALDAVVRRAGLLPGPDLYSWFEAHPERLADGLHPDDRGAVEASRLWAEAVAPLYP
ncbi:MAG TPA: GDSL-type esterase/lipase family protein [Anaeromyxobacteraceae bacterium]|nr:GDSL-type esterase/lipase family protein [Anaeromyxobacteraceae bacterium]